MGEEGNGELGSRELGIESREWGVGWADVTLHLKT